ncbi:rod-binding protein [Labrenzia sp. CE80]|uniref:rod-binding protein n=1 Tax=Labrenzia sp. CE80 TaxID=1788986 RepID=UPI00129BF099|nr:rod-binding protein [Labrenzia sp. CE80]
MAISPPSDLILEVSRAANPVDLREATTKLSRLSRSSGAGELSFAEAMGPNQFPSFASISSTRDTSSVVRSASQSPAEKFEALVLHQFVETMLPDDAGQVFGEGATGEIWKSMLAEQVGNQIAASGGVGIADLLSTTLKDNA